MKLQMISELRASTVGHAALDVAGLVPGVGEPADFTNALWYADEGDYLSAVFSLISMIPEVGDAFGKGMKYLGKSSPMIQRMLLKYSDDVAKYWPKIKSIIIKNQKWKPYVREMDDMVKTILQQKEQGHQQ